MREGGSANARNSSGLSSRRRNGAGDLVGGFDTDWRKVAGARQDRPGLTPPSSDQEAALRAIPAYRVRGIGPWQGV